MTFELKTVLKNFTLFARLGGNSKTGKGVMISILPNGGFDLETVRSKGSSACGDCPHATTAKREAEYKRLHGKLKVFKHGTCYVYKRVGGSQGALGGINNGFHRCDTVSLVKFIQQITVLAELTGFIRIGEFGDPAADMQTADIIAAILVSIDSEVVRAAYTHQWRKAKAKNLKGLVMASCENDKEKSKALKNGWSVFQVVGRKDIIKGIHCPAQKTGGEINCDTCGKCDGIGNKLIQINLH